MERIVGGIRRGDIRLASKVCELVSCNVCTQSASVVTVKVRFQPIEGCSRLKLGMVVR